MGKKKSGNGLTAQDAEWLAEGTSDSADISKTISAPDFSVVKDFQENVFPVDTAKDETLLKRQAKNKRNVELMFNSDKQLDMAVFDFSENEHHKSLNDYFDEQGEDFKYGKVILKKENYRTGFQYETWENRPTHPRKNVLDHVRKALTIYKKTPEYVSYKKEKPAIVIEPCDENKSGIWITVMPKSKAEKDFNNHQKLLAYINSMRVYDAVDVAVHENIEKFFAQNRTLASKVSLKDKIDMIKELGDVNALPKDKEVVLVASVKDNGGDIVLEPCILDEVDQVFKKRTIQTWQREQQAKPKLAA